MREMLLSEDIHLIRTFSYAGNILRIYRMDQCLGGCVNTYYTVTINTKEEPINKEPPWSWHWHKSINPLTKKQPYSYAGGYLKALGEAFQQLAGLDEHSEQSEPGIDPEMLAFINRRPKHKRL